MVRPDSTASARRFAREMRSTMPMAEAILWGFLKGGQMGVRFRRQVPIGPWVADFASLDPRVVIEVDGPSHADRDEADRTAFIEAQGFVILRVPNRPLIGDPDWVVEWLESRIEQLPRREPNPPRHGEG